MHAHMYVGRAMLMAAEQNDKCKCSDTTNRQPFVLTKQNACGTVHYKSIQTLQRTLCKMQSVEVMENVFG